MNLVLIPGAKLDDHRVTWTGCIKGFMASLYSYESESQEIANSEDEKNDQKNFIIEHEDKKEVHIEAVKSKIKRKKATNYVENIIRNIR